jgi:hypothetical protein
MIFKFIKIEEWYYYIFIVICNRSFSNILICNFFIVEVSRYLFHLSVYLNFLFNFSLV